MRVILSKVLLAILSLALLAATVDSFSKVQTGVSVHERIRIAYFVSDSMDRECLQSLVRAQAEIDVSKVDTIQLLDKSVLWPHINWDLLAPEVLAAEGLQRYVNLEGEYLLVTHRSSEGAPSTFALALSPSCNGDGGAKVTFKD